MLQKIKKGQVSFQDAFSRMYPGNTFAIKDVTFCVTEECNLRCSYCYEVRKNNNRMTREVGEKTIDMLFEEYAKGGRYLNSENSEGLILDFIGGEPLLEIDLINHLVEYFKFKAISTNHPWALKYMIAITTNGILYEQPKVQDFIERNKNNLSIGITIDGNKELHDSCRKFPNGAGSYDIVEKAVKIEVSKDTSPATKLTLAPGNIAYLVDAFKNLVSLGLTSINANTVYEKGWNVDHAKIFYEQLKGLADYMIDDGVVYDVYCSLFQDTLGKPIGDEDNKNWCGGTGLMLAIDTKGNFYPCLRYLPFTLQNDRKPMIIGNIYDGLEHTEEETKCVDCLKCITRKSQSTDECFNCPIARGCAWCSGYNYDQFGTPDKRATYICVMHKARVMANVYFWNKLYKLQGSPLKFKMNIPKEWALEIIDEKEYDMLMEIQLEDAQITPTV